MRRIRLGLILVLPMAAMTGASSRAAGPAETVAKEFAQKTALSFFEKRFEYEHLNLYISFRMMLNPGQEIEALLDDYFEKFYGSGASGAKSLFADIEKSSIAIAQAMPKDERYIPFPPSRTWSDEFIGPATLQKYRQQADDLVRLTKGTRHERAAELISRFLVGRMEQASARAMKVELQP